MTSNIKISVMALVAILPAFINAQAGVFSQCGGQGWTYSELTHRPSTVGSGTTTTAVTTASTPGGTATVPPVSSSTFAPTYSVVSIPATGTGTGTDTEATPTSTPGASPITLVNFSHTCENIDFSGDILKASCKDWGGSFKSTSINTNECIGNSNGVLVAGSGYINSCSGTTWSSATVTINSTCTNRQKQPVPASLNFGQSGVCHVQPSC
ncbi:hypothetical protein DFH09DRAFT_1427638 [Mycena vulgaris]|nr:hypothetical protein DFH09DRAFT_1427638 [Mycena vulgaris]